MEGEAAGRVLRQGAGKCNGSMANRNLTRISAAIGTGGAVKQPG